MSLLTLWGDFGLNVVLNTTFAFRGEYKNGCSIWRMENAAGSFYAHSYIAPPSRSLVCELCETLLRTTIPLGTEAEKLDPRPETISNQGSLRRLPSINARLDSSASVKGSSGRYLITTPQFERLWWDKGSELRRPASIWRPIVPPGYAIVGDCLVERYVSAFLFTQLVMPFENSKKVYK